MLSRLLKLTFVVLFALTGFSVSSYGCSYADGYLDPTIFERVKDTEAIVVARAVSELKDGLIQFEPISRLKGEIGTEAIVVPGRGGMCSPYVYSVRGLYILFLNKHQGDWILSASAATQFDRDVSAPGSVDVSRVKHLVRVGAIVDYSKQQNELKKLRDLARSNSRSDLYPAILVKDVDDYLNSPSPDKSFEELMRLHERLPVEGRPAVLWAIAKSGHKEAAAFWLNLVARAKTPAYDGPNFIGPISEYVSRTKHAGLFSELAKAYPRLDKHIRWPIMNMMIDTADGSQSDVMLNALRSADKEEAGRLAVWFVRYPSEEAADTLRALVGNNYQVEWEIAFSLAGMGDVGTLDWAIKFMNSADKERWMAYYVLARSPLQMADELAKDVIKGDDPDALASLIQGYRNSRNPNRFDRLRDILQLRNRDSKIDDWLRRTLLEMESGGDEGATELLQSLKSQQKK